VPLQPAALELLSALSPVLSRWGRWYVFGAQAVITYGVPRLSADVDVTVGLDPDAGAWTRTASVARCCCSTKPWARAISFPASSHSCGTARRRSQAALAPDPQLETSVTEQLAIAAAVGGDACCWC
jgi:hypothetical protein